MNNPYSSGTADDWYSGRLNDLWVEYKYIPRVPQRGSVQIAKLFSVLQHQWLSGRHREGRNVAAIIGCPAGGIVLRDLEWEQENLSLAEFRARLRERTDLAGWIRQQTEG